MTSPEYYPKPDRNHILLRERAFFEVFLPALASGEKLDLDRERELLKTFNNQNSGLNSAKITPVDVFYASLKAIEKTYPGITNGHILALGFLALDDLQQTLPRANEDIAWIKQAEIAFVGNLVMALMPEVGPKAPKGFSAQNWTGSLKRR